ncbi:hypothetical protein L0N00_15375, partial [Eggerthella lenta]|nr:hypothetical protein [Eggerthella lenta]
TGLDCFSGINRSNGKSVRSSTGLPLCLFSIRNYHDRILILHDFLHHNDIQYDGIEPLQAN